MFNKKKESEGVGAGEKNKKKKQNKKKGTLGEEKKVHFNVCVVNKEACLSPEEDSLVGGGMDLDQIDTFGPVGGSSVVEGAGRAVDLITIEEQYDAVLDFFGLVDYRVAVEDAADLEKKQLADADRQKGKHSVSAGGLAVKSVDQMEEPNDRRKKAALGRCDQLISAMVQSTRVRLKDSAGEGLSSGKGWAVGV